jgi:hypothetical protein
MSELSLVVYVHIIISTIGVSILKTSMQYTDTNITNDTIYNTSLA